MNSLPRVRLMSDQLLGDPLTPDLRETLETLAAGLFGLDAWVKESAKYKPPDPDLPWRAPGHTFAPKDLGVIPFFEGLLRESSGDDDLAGRWAAVSADPLKFSPLLDAQGWRSRRGLTNPAKFGVVVSSNVQIVDSGGNPISRHRFYVACWSLLQSVVRARKAQGTVNWQILAEDLFSDRDPQWPNSKQPPSSAFITQFTFDMLYAMLGIRNPAEPPWRYALLVELGEHRRVGNAYKPKDARVAVNNIRQLITKLTQQPPPSPAPTPVHVPPVGSPAHDMT